MLFKEIIVAYFENHMKPTAYIHTLWTKSRVIDCQGGWNIYRSYYLALKDTEFIDKTIRNPNSTVCLKPPPITVTFSLSHYSYQEEEQA
jgi:hypothetical protein